MNTSEKTFLHGISITQEEFSTPHESFPIADITSVETQSRSYITEWGIMPIAFFSLSIVRLLTTDFDTENIRFISSAVLILVGIIWCYLWRNKIVKVHSVVIRVKEQKKIVFRGFDKTEAEKISKALNNRIINNL